MQQTESVTIVPSGGMRVMKTGVLKAYLGSCVGVAIHDPVSQIGGMAHVLLPDPICSIPETHLGSYASTAIPRLVENMISRGANPAAMVAYIAGGALVDPLSPNDLSLNIGGQTIDITLKLLNTCGIPIRQLEASGYTPFQMIFEPSSGKCTIEPIISMERDSSESPVPIKPLTEDNIREIIDRIIPVPQITLKVIKMLTDEAIDLPRIAVEVKREQVLTAKTLKLCNSSYISPAKEITSIDQALVYLGNKTMLRLVITAQAEQLLRQFGNGYSLCRGGMYYHALGTARLCEKIAHKTGQIPEDTAYTAGLLHDIGKVVLDQYIADKQPQFYRRLQLQNADSGMIEKEMFGLDHSAVGAMLIDAWHLPEIYKTVIACHHHPELADSNRELVHLVYLADIFMHRFMFGPELEQINTAAIDDSLKLLDIEPQDIFSVIGCVTEID